MHYEEEKKTRQAAIDTGYIQRYSSLFDVID